MSNCSFPHPPSQIVTRTAPIVGPFIPAIVDKFYADLLEKHPSVKSLLSKRNIQVEYDTCMYTHMLLRGS